MVEFEPFHSAVNRIPVLRDKAQGLAEDGMLPEDLFATGKAPGHDHLEPEKLSGSIDLEMIVRTPLVFGEQTVDTKGPKDRHFIDLPMDDDGGLVDGGAGVLLLVAVDEDVEGGGLGGGRPP